MANPATGAATVATATDRTALETPPPELLGALKRYLLALADDEMLLGHRDAEWTGLGPILEEDIAFSSMAQDELGHAKIWYGLRHELGEPSPDRQAFLRDAPDWLNARLLELDRGDYAASLVRQYLFDLAELLRLEALTGSAWKPLADAALKLRQEEKYHLLHGQAYLERLAKGADEARDLLQAALDRLWPYALAIWEPVEGEADLVAAGIVPASAALAPVWRAAVVTRFERAGLTVPLSHDAVTGGRRGEHGPELVTLLAAMQGLYRSDPEADW
ncbi:MAG TPA: phenylacetate-CoA oxygenase subunit PaaC [Anaerolineae bacterium]|nr:phenylacetate-CoA oxygenase subunit PaaC [Anaerolineae bacterium]